jgi:DNA-binding transcriptional ArsR family regulator
LSRIADIAEERRDESAKISARATNVMREKDFSTGLRGVLFEAKHHARMGSAVWLYGWLVLRQTHQSGDLGWVLGGAPITYREIEAETGFNPRTLERWLRDLRREGYIETTSMQQGISIRITKAKKFPQGVRKSAEGVRKSAGGSTRSCGANTEQPFVREEFAGRMNSLSIVRMKEIEAQRQSCGNLKEEQQYNSNKEPKDTNYALQKHNPSGLEKNRNHSNHPVQERERSQHQQSLWELRLRQQLLRAERDEEVRRELAVGGWPGDPRR